ncbi:hypothetical protein J6O48_03320 [bacterium]|nr:hypothetical protein [bacterium]
MIVTEYNKLYVLRNPENNKVVLTYWVSSQKHKAIFPTRQGAENVNKKWLNNFYIVEEL